ncbi:hypothetical protein J4Q44_G00048390, partial [Coregonus suidteri]
MLQTRLLEFTCNQELTFVSALSNVIQIPEYVLGALTELLNRVRGREVGTISSYLETSMDLRVRNWFPLSISTGIMFDVWLNLVHCLADEVLFYYTGLRH